MPQLNGYEGRVVTIDANHFRGGTWKIFPELPDAGSSCCNHRCYAERDILHEMRASYKHKFAKKPEVIDGNMKALEMAFAAVEEA